MAQTKFGQEITTASDATLLEMLKKADVLSSSQFQLLRIEIERRDTLKKWESLPGALRRSWIAIVISGLALVVSAFAAFRCK